MTTAGTGSGTSPLIASLGMSANDFDGSEFMNDDYDPLGASSPLPNLDLSTGPDAIHLLNPSALYGHKTDVSSQPNFVKNSATAAATTTSPDSFNDSFRDSSSDSASSKRTGSSASARTALTAGDVMMTDGTEIKPEWNQAHFLTGHDDGVFMFGNDSSAVDDAFGVGDDKFMDESFDFDSASSSPNGAGALNMESPEMPTIQTSTPQRTYLPAKERSQGHSKNYSFSLTQSMNGLKTSGSREVSPMSSNMITSHEASPSALFQNSPSPSAPADYANGAAAGPVNGAAFWPSNLDISPQAMNHGVPMPQYHTGDALPVSMAHQLPLFAQPQFNAWNGRCQLTIHPTPSKSRVETQIPIKMTLFPLPPGVTRLHLPTHTISKPKLLAKPPAERSPDMLELYTMLVCTSAMQSEENKQKAFRRAAAASHAPLVNSRSASEDDDEDSKPQNGGEVRICTGCITRERKRAARKKIKKIEEEEMWNRDETRRVIVFNTQEVKEWQQPSGIVTDSTVTGRPEPVVPNGAMQVDAPMRIACYCRHHAEKLGFQVILTIKDWQDRVIAQEISQSIMITDDHKTHPMPAQLGAPSSQSSDATLMPLMNGPLDSGSMSAPGGPFRLSQSSSDLQSLAQRNAVPPSFPASAVSPPSSSAAVNPPRSLSRPASPIHSAPASKKRKASSTRLPIGMAMTRLDTSPPPTNQSSSKQVSAGPSAATSPFTPSLTSFQPSDSVFSQTTQPQAAIGQPFATGPPTPNSNEQVLFSNANRSASMENMAMPMFSAPASAHPSRAPSPNGLRNSINAIPQTQFSQALASSLYSLPVGVNQSRPQPTIHKIIPNEGPKSGGIEVTILGASFYQGLEVLFGDQKATTTTFWGESSLVCLLPPSPVAGPVFVTFKHQQAQAPQPFQSMSKQQPIFKYVDDDEEKLIRTALSILGHKMSGQMVDVKELAQRILGEGDSSWGNMLGQFSGSGFNGGFKMNVESQLMKCLELIDLDDSPRVPRLDLRRATGQTMLHLGCSLGFNRFVAGLLARGANPDLRDKGGFTPMHLAAMNNHSEIVRRLIQVGADPTIRTLSGLVAADVARSRQVLRAIRRCERHTRSRSGGSLHSRANSAASLRSLWDPLTMSDESEQSASGEESPEYSSGDFEDEEEEEEMWLSMRRRSAHALSTEPDRSDLLPQAPAELQVDFPSPTTALAAATAVRDQVAAQIQQFQQAMALHFPNLTQFPNLPQMPVLPDYQAYLHSAPFMRRVTSLVPGRNGSRPGSAGDEQPKVIDNRWWDFSSYMSNSAAPPPAYSDIFPQEDLDKKQASAALAAVDAEADIKCAALYDTQTVTANSNEDGASTSMTPLPSVLKIGRKSAITKEQQQVFLRAHEAKLKGMRSDMNLWFIWIPLLTFVLAAMMYSRFPEYFILAWGILRSFAGFERAPYVAREVQDRIVEVL